eukprot:g15615.t1
MIGATDGAPEGKTALSRATTSSTAVASRFLTTFAPLKLCSWCPMGEPMLRTGNVGFLGILLGTLVISRTAVRPKYVDVQDVLVQRDPWAFHTQAEEKPSALFFYSHDAIPIDLTAGSAYSLQTGWVYGAKRSTSTLAVVTGNSSDVLQGKLIVWPPSVAKDKLKTAKRHDASWRIVSVVLEDGAFADAWMDFSEHFEGKSPPILVYDGGCPFCNHFAQRSELVGGISGLQIRDGRADGHLRAWLKSRGFDVATGAVLIDGNDIFHGSQAINWLCVRMKPSDPLLQVLRPLFGGPDRSKALYPFLLLARKVALTAKGLKEDPDA